MTTQPEGTSPEVPHRVGLYFEDLHIGDVFVSSGRTVTETDVVGFAGISGDFNPIHVNTVSAAEGRYARRVAHGLLGMSIATGLLDRMAIFHSSMIAMLSVSDWSFRAPIFIGDTIRLELSIVSTRLTKRGNSGIVVRRLRILNQDDTIVQEGTITVMVACRPDDGVSREPRTDALAGLPPQPDGQPQPTA